MKRFFHLLLAIGIGCSSLPAGAVWAQEGVLTAPMAVTQPYQPMLLRGVQINPDKPFEMDFIISDTQKQMNLEYESNKLIQYFLAALTTPEEDLWVNLSPYEQQRIMDKNFGDTEMGRLLLTQDHLLKQFVVSLLHPDDVYGKRFWKQVYAEALKRYGTTDIPANMFHKVWIVPKQAIVYENRHGREAYIVESQLKVMLEEDYLAKTKQKKPVQSTYSLLSTQIMREVIIPVIEQEVNQGAHFAPLRQMYHAVILARWYKSKFDRGFLSEAYIDQHKTDGIAHGDAEAVQKIWMKYVQSFEEGVYDFIKEEQSVVRRYFSGGMNFLLDEAMTVTRDHYWMDQFKEKAKRWVKVSAGMSLLFGTPALPTLDAKDIGFFKWQDPADDNWLYVVEENDQEGYLQAPDGSNRFAYDLFDSDLSDTQQLMVAYSMSGEQAFSRVYLIDTVDQSALFVTTLSWGKQAQEALPQEERAAFINMLQDIVRIRLTHYQSSQDILPEIQSLSQDYAEYPFYEESFFAGLQKPFNAQGWGQAKLTHDLTFYHIDHLKADSQINQTSEFGLNRYVDMGWYAPLLFQEWFGFDVDIEMNEATVLPTHPEASLVTAPLAGQDQMRALGWSLDDGSYAFFGLLNEEQDIHHVGFLFQELSQEPQTWASSFDAAVRDKRISSTLFMSYWLYLIDRAYYDDQFSLGSMFFNAIVSVRDKEGRFVLRNEDVSFFVDRFHRQVSVEEYVFLYQDLIGDLESRRQTKLINGEDVSVEEEALAKLYTAMGEEAVSQSSIYSSEAHQDMRQLAFVVTTVTAAMTLNDTVMARMVEKQGNYGGIDFTSAMLNLSINKEAHGASLFDALSPAEQQRLRHHFTGIQPVIISVQPLPALAY